MTPLLLALLGLCVGSFANVCVHRLPRDESLWRPRSRCPSCKTPVAWFDNVPLVSYLRLRGRCRSCGGRISPRYPLVEGLCALLWAAVGLRAGSDPAALAGGLVLATGVLVQTFVDWEWKLIPDEITYPLLAAGLLLSPWTASLGGGAPGRLANSAAGALVGAGILWGAGLIGRRVWKKDAMGMGDVKLAAGLGAFLGWQGVAYALIAGSALGGLWGGVQILSGKLKRRDYIPFGPFLGAGGLALWFLQIP